MAELECFVDFSLACARFLPALPDDHPCRRVHGHTFDVRVVLRGGLDPARHWVVDFADVERIWRQRVHEVLDHRLLNDLPGLEHPTSERLVLWLRDALQPVLPALARFEVRESGRYGVALDVALDVAPPAR